MDVETPDQPIDTARPTDDGGSLADHEQQFHTPDRRGARPAVEPATDAAPAADDEPAPAVRETRERDETGKFVKPAEKPVEKPRHRAKSQEASPEDVPRIRELTKRLREAETRAEAAERRAAERVVERTAADTPKPAAKPAAERFPSFEKWIELPENKDKDGDDWLTEHAQWNYQRLRAQEREAEAREASEREYQDSTRSYADKIPAVVKKYPDFEDVVASAPQVSKAIEVAVIAVGPEAAYYLATHPEEAAELTDDTLYCHPDNPAFKAVVASTRRYLASLVASEQRPSPSSRPAAAPSGSALALVPPTSPKPPNPGRTTNMRDADVPPGDESSLAEHEQAFYKTRRASR